MRDPDDFPRDVAAADLRRLAQRWFADAQQASAQDEAEVAAWTQQQRKRTGRSAADWGNWSLRWSTDDDGGDCGGDGGCD